MSALKFQILLEITRKMTAYPDKENRSKATVELHFQEIFSGEHIDIVVDGEVRAQFVAKTRFQTGLAHIETIELYDEQEVVLKIQELNLKATVKVERYKPFVIVKLKGGKLHTENTEISPGYL